MFIYIYIWMSFSVSLHRVQGTAPGELSLAMTVSPDEVFEADHEKLQLTLEGDVIDGASSSSSSTSQALLQLQRRTSHRRTNSTHTKASIKGRSKKSLTFEGVGTYVRAKKLGEGSYGKAYLYKNANNPQDMVRGLWICLSLCGHVNLIVCRFMHVIEFLYVRIQYWYVCLSVSLDTSIHIGIHVYIHIRLW